MANSSNGLNVRAAADAHSFLMVSKDKMQEYMTAFKATAKKINDEIDVFDDENKEWLEEVFTPIEQAMLIVEEKFEACGNSINKLVEVASDVHARAKAAMGTAQDAATAAKNKLN